MFQFRNIKKVGTYNIFIKMGNNTFRRFILISFQNFPAMGVSGPKSTRSPPLKLEILFPTILLPEPELI